VTPLERHCGWLLRAYPLWYRRKRAGEMLGTLLEASPPGRRWPSFRDARALVIGGLRVRGRVWWLSMLWVSIGAAVTGYTFFITTKPFTNADFWIPLWNTEPEALSIAAYLTVAAWVVLTTPVLIAGFAQLRWRGLRIAAWASAWLAGFALMYQAGKWGEYPGNSPAIGSPAVMSWGELGLFAAWLALGAVMTWILAAPHHSRNAPEASSRSSRQASS
jgi:hypothetical protein